MHLENTSPATSLSARCTGLGAKPTDLTPPPLGLDEDDWLPDVLELEMLATPMLEPPPQPAMRTATPTSTTGAASARKPPRSRWRALTVSAGRMVKRLIHFDVLNLYSRQAESCDRDPSNPRSPLKLRDSHAAAVTRLLPHANERLQTTRVATALDDLESSRSRSAALMLLGGGERPAFRANEGRRPAPIQMPVLAATQVSV
jgi:hypothetical protein